MKCTNSSTTRFTVLASLPNASEIIGYDTPEGTTYCFELDEVPELIRSGINPWTGVAFPDKFISKLKSYTAKYNKKFAKSAHPALWKKGWSKKYEESGTAGEESTTSGATFSPTTFNEALFKKTSFNFLQGYKSYMNAKIPYDANVQKDVSALAKNTTLLRILLKGARSSGVNEESIVIALGNSWKIKEFHSLNEFDQFLVDLQNDLRKVEIENPGVKALANRQYIAEKRKAQRDAITSFHKMTSMEKKERCMKYLESYKRVIQDLDENGWEDEDLLRSYKFLKDQLSRTSCVMYDEVVETLKN